MCLMAKNYHKFKDIKEALSRGLPASKALLVAGLYFAEGAPFGLLFVLMPVFLRLEGTGLKEIGLLSLLSLFWSAKPLWAYLVDSLGEYRYWILASWLIIIAASLVLGVSASQVALVTALLALALAGANQDIAIDGLTITILEKKELGIANGIRVAAYRLALIATGGGLVALSEILPWETIFLLFGAIFLALMPLLSRRLIGPPAAESARKQRRVRQTVVFTFRNLLKRPGIVPAAVFILLFKLGDTAMGPMVHPFWVDAGFSRAEIGLISGSLGTALSIAGAMAGGIITSRIGLVRGLLYLGAAQALSNLGYALAAALETSRPLVYSASALESFTGGLGTAPFLAYLMALCDRQAAASQYALLSTLFSLTRSLSGALSGWLAEALGYASFFLMTFFLALPGLLLVPLAAKALDSGKTNKR